MDGDGFGIEGRDYKGILYRVYSKHNPEKLSDIDSLLERFKGREEDLVHDLHYKYPIEEGDLEADMDMSHPRTILYAACMQLGLDEKAVMFIEVSSPPSSPASSLPSYIHHPLTRTMLT